jgi:hypothetical protein
MRLETIPLVLGALIGLIGVGLVLDAWMEEDVATERRKRPRRPRNRFGEALVGFGTIAMAVAFLGRDNWRYSTITVIAGAILLLWGLKRNLPYLRETFVRGQHRKIPATPNSAPAEDPTFVPGSRRLR